MSSRSRFTHTNPAAVFIPATLAAAFESNNIVTMGMGMFLSGRRAQRSQIYQLDSLSQLEVFGEQKVHGMMVSRTLTTFLRPTPYSSESSKQREWQDLRKGLLWVQPTLAIGSPGSRIQERADNTRLSWHSTAHLTATRKLLGGVKELGDYNSEFSPFHAPHASHTAVAHAN